MSCFSYFTFPYSLFTSHFSRFTSTLSLQDRVVKRKLIAMKKFLFTILLLPVVAIASSFSEAWGDSRNQDKEVEFIGEIQQLLAGQGFENVVVKSRSQQEVIVEYENRRYRYELRAMGVVCALVSSKAEHVGWLTLIPKNRDIPLVQVRINLRDYDAFIKGEISKKTFASRLEISQDPISYEPDSGNSSFRTNQANGSFRKIDLVINPDINVRLGNYDDPYKWQLNIIPGISSYLFKGMKATAELIIPLENELDEGGNDVRPGKIVLNHTIRLPGNFFSSISSGYFDLNRYGLSVECLKFLLNGNLSFSAKVDYTGFLIYIDKQWYYSDLNKWTYLLSGTYQFSPLDFSISLAQGRFLAGDRGWRIDVLRSFGETDIGFFAIKTNAETLGGFRLHIPIFPMRRLTPSRIRASPPLYFDRTYRYSYNDSGKSISTGPVLMDFIKKLVPSYIRNNVEELKLEN